MKTPKRLLLPFCISIASSPLIAQEHKADNFVLEELIVTAQRKHESLQDAAIPVNAATGTRLQDIGVANAGGLNKIAPALYVSQGGGANAGYFVRGVGNFTNNGYSNPAVAFNIDGVYIGRTSSTAASFLDVNRVEILKGPQGTLYGRNATGGAINVIPSAPSLESQEGNVTVEVGNYDHRSVTAFYNQPLSDKAALRIAGTYSEHDGYFDDGTNRAEDSALRIQFLSELDEQTSLRLSADYASQKGSGPGTDVKGTYTFSPFTPASISNGGIANWNFVPANLGEFAGLHNADTLAFIEDTATAAPLFSPLTGFAYPFRDDQYWGINAEFTTDLGFGELVVIPAYRYSELDNQFNGPPFKAAFNEDEAKQSSLEARLSGISESTEWILGGYYFDETVEGVNSFNQFATVTHNSWKSDVESFAVFGRLSYTLSDELRLVAGVRYTEEDRALNAISIASAGVCLIEPAFGAPSCPQVPTFPVGLTFEDTFNQLLADGLIPALPDIAEPGTAGVVPYGPFGAMGPQAIISSSPDVFDLSKSENKVTYRLAVEYDLSENSLVYVSFETGFRAGGFNTSFGNESYDPEFIDAYTIGSKNRFFNDRLELNMEAFLWKYDDQQLSALGVDARGNNSFYARNVGQSTIQGFELDFQFLATPNTLLRGGLQLLDATYDTFIYNQVDLSDAGDPPNFLTPVTGCSATQIFGDNSQAPRNNNVAPPPRSFDIDCSGKDALFSPDITASLGLQQTIALDGSTLILNADLRYRAERWVGFGYYPGAETDSTLNLDLSLSWLLNNNLSLSVYGRNLTDEYTQTSTQLGAGNVLASALEAPRTFGARLAYDF